MDLGGRSGDLAIVISPSFHWVYIGESLGFPHEKCWVSYGLTMKVMGNSGIDHLNISDMGI